MPVGIIYVVRCHEDSVGVLVFDSVYVTSFSHESSVVAPFAQVYIDDVRNTPNDAWLVKLLYPLGTDPGNTQTLQDLLDDAETAIDAQYNVSGVGPSSPPSGYH